MITGHRRFNIYLLIFSLGLAVCACRSTKEEKPEDKLSTLRVHMEVNGLPADFCVTVPVLRRNPLMVTVDKDPFLTELNVASAKVVDVLGGYALQVEFDHTGSMLMENYTTANPGRRMAVFSLFGKEKEQSRWLGAPLIAKRITNGIIIFTPDATREECDRVVLGLNNFARKNQKKNQW